jgi:hypothetical protein
MSPDRDVMVFDQKAPTTGAKDIALRQDPKIGQGLNAEFVKRIRLCREKKPTSPEPNCIGAALFIAGEIDSDRFVDINTAYASFLKHLQRIENPVIGCMVAWTCDFDSFISVEHMGVVTATAPRILVTHREYRGGPFIEDQPIEVAGGRYYQFSRSDEGKEYWKEEYFLPRALSPRL